MRQPASASQGIVMEHVVFYQSTQGTPAFRRMASIEDAVSFAEHLRNVEGVTDFSVYALTPVSLKLRAYYHVEISEAGRAAARQAPTEPGPSDTVPVETVPVESEPTEAPPAAAAEAPTPPATPPALPEPAPVATDRYAIPAEVAKPDETAAAEPTAAVETASPAAPPSIPEMPFVAGPTAGPTASRFTSADAFVKDDPAESAASELPHASDHPVIDPSVVDPTVEEVVPVPPGRRSMGFFARS
jgi:hypothetical protein